MNIGELKRNLSAQSLEKVREATGDIKSMLEVRERLKELLYNPNLNFWEEAIRILDNSEFCQKKDKDRYIAFCLLFVDIRRNGLKFPILIQRKRDDGFPLNKWMLLNGHHRMAIADILELDEMPIKFIDAKAEN